MDDIIGNEKMEATPVNVSPVRPQLNKKYCKYCGKELDADAVFCSSCGRPQGNVPIQQMTGQMMQQPVYGIPYMVSPYQSPQPTAAPNVMTNNTTTVIVERNPSNGIGVAGFVIALLGIFFLWLPFINCFLWLFGFVFSFVGLFKAPRGMAIAGFVLSLVDILLIIHIMGSIAAALALA